MKRTVLLLAVIIATGGCKQSANTSIDEAALCRDMTGVARAVIVDFYKQNNTWPSSSSELVTFCERHKKNYPDTAVEVCKRLHPYPLPDGRLHIKIDFVAPLPEQPLERLQGSQGSDYSPKLTMMLMPNGKFAQGKERFIVRTKDPNRIIPYTEIEEPIRKRINN